MHDRGHEEEFVEGEDDQACRFNKAVMFERGRQAAKGYDAAHDDEHGLDHLLMWSQRYAARGEHVKAQALVQAAREYLGRHRAVGDIPEDPEPWVELRTGVRSATAFHDRGIWKHQPRAGDIPEEPPAVTDEMVKAAQVRFWEVTASPDSRDAMRRALEAALALGGYRHPTPEDNDA